MEATVAPPPFSGTPSGPVPIDIHTQGPQATASPAQVTKVIIAVHGVGDQHNFGTLQSVVNRFCCFYEAPPAVPLGSFHTDDHSFYSLASPYPPKPFQELAFAEVYWAPIPREVVKERYTLEEAKNWARTIVERLHMRQKQVDEEQKRTPTTSAHAEIDANFERIKFIMTELIESLAVMERLCYVADRAGIFSFNLRKLLEDYLGDVQVVAEFKSQRARILKEFQGVLNKVQTQYPKAEIHFIAHSEGTVVALLGLLEAINNPKEAEWIYQVRGLMTLGSPIDKHIALWPNLFSWKTPTLEPKKQLFGKIQWRNYYDYGDPIGFELDDARAELTKNKLDSLFDFAPEDDMGFARYPFPGKAHVDYWDDEQVFGHFIHKVINKGASDVSAHARFDQPPRDKKTTQFLSNVLPYLGLLVLLFGATYVVFKALIDYFPHAVKNDKLYESNAFIFWSVLGGACIMSGITVLARLPRLHRLQESKWSHIGAWLGCLTGLGLGWFLLAHQFGNPTLHHNWLDDRAWIAYVAWFLPGALLLYWASVKHPTWGTRPLLVFGLLSILLIVVIGTQVVDLKEHELGPLWPAFLATAGCLYLWWLAALLFDLICIWHASIRQSSCVKHIKDLVAPTPLQSTTAVQEASAVSEVVGERQKVELV